jgi:hypothetical protein
MKTKIFILSLLMCTFACTPTGIHTSWKQVNQQPATVNKILVAVILPEEDSMLRIKLESQLSSDLNRIGYRAVSAWEEFGILGLARLGQEETYLVLCENGIDAVLTLALMNTIKTEDQLHGRIQEYSNIYYYNRIWNYKRSYKKQLIGNPQREKQFMEAFLYDLAELQPVYFSDTHSFSGDAPASLLQHHAAAIFKDMMRKKVLIPKPKPRAA